MPYGGHLQHIIDSAKSLYDLFAQAAGLTYHVWGHTVQVAEAGKKIGEKENISVDEMLLLQTGIAIHDIGNIIRRQGHEDIGAAYARNVLAYKYMPAEIETVADLVLATKFPHNPQNHLQQIICDADMSLMGYHDWAERIDAYRIELGITDEQQWHIGQKAFMEAHRWFTPAAKQLYDEQKQKNISYLKRMIK